jgi:Putative adhesin
MQRIVLASLLSALAFFPVLDVSALGRSEGSIQKTWDYPSGIQTVVVDADSQDVVVKEGTGVSGRLLGRSGDDVKVDRKGGKLVLTARSDRSWFSWGRTSSRVELTVPAGLELDLTTASGAVLVQVATKTLRARSASGDIEAAQGGAAADVDSTSGTVRLKGFSGPVRASSLSGDLRLESLTGDLQAATMSGSLTGTGLSPAGRSRFTTVSGDLDLRLAGGSSAFRIAAESVSGGLSIGGQKGSDSMTVGSGPSVTVKSVSGDVRVE